jgi:hypothetical protein
MGTPTREMGTKADEMGPQVRETSSSAKARRTHRKVPEMGPKAS